MRLKIFLVEDSPVIRDNIVELLQEMTDSKIVGHAATQTEALSWLLDSGNAWDLAVVDLFLADGNGITVLHKCCGRDPKRKMVVLSNYATPEIRQRCASVGADGVFDKSTQIDDFVDYVLRKTSRNKDASLFGDLESL